MSTHTPEPWVTGRKDMQSYHGHTGTPFSSIYREADDERMPLTSDGLGGMARVPLRIAYIEGKDIPREEEKANADRIVACVNAMKGMSDPAAFVARARAIEAAARMIRERKGDPVAELSTKASSGKNYIAIPVHPDRWEDLALALNMPGGEVNP